MTGRRKTLLDRMADVPSAASPAGTKPAGADPRSAAGRRPEAASRAAPPKIARGIPSQVRRDGQRITVPFASLHLSTDNVRKVAKYKRVAELADDLLAHGIIQNLVVKPSQLVAGEYEVTAGGRRYAALQLLFEHGSIDAKYQVPVLIDDADDPRETSLAENIQQEPMNPADEATAWADLVAGRASLADDPVAYVAKRFGVTTSYVAARLRLAELPEEILDALRDETIPLDAALAYAIVPDADLQRQVFAAESCRTLGRQHDPRAIRDAMRAKTYSTNVRQALYVGMDAYLAAGGLLGRDLFMGQDEGELILQPALVDQLAREKATGELADRAAADGFASGMLTLGFNSVPSWPKAPGGMTRVFGAAPGGVPADRRGDMIGIYNIEADGSGLMLDGAYRPVAHLADRDPPRTPPPGPVLGGVDFSTSTAPDANGIHAKPHAAIGDRDTDLPPVPDRVAALTAKQRWSGDRLEAAQAAVRDDLTGTRFQNRVTYPTAIAVPALDNCPDGSMLVAVQFRIQAVDIDAATLRLIRDGMAGS